MARPVVVYIGIEWDQLPPSFTPERRLQIKDGIAAALADLTARGYDARWCGVGLDRDLAAAAVRAAVAGPVDAVLIGAGLRLTEAALELFEVIVNVVHQACPRAALCFNSTPADSGPAVARWLPPR